MTYVAAFLVTTASIVSSALDHADLGLLLAIVALLLFAEIVLDLRRAPRTDARRRNRP